MHADEAEGREPGFQRSQRLLGQVLLAIHTEGGVLLERPEVNDAARIEDPGGRARMRNDPRRSLQSGRVGGHTDRLVEAGARARARRSASARRTRLTGLSR